MRIFLSLLSLLALFLNGFAAPLTVPLRQSQQFTVIDARPVGMVSPGQLRSGAGQDLIRLDADTLLMSAERVRDLLSGELGFNPAIGGRIRLVLYPARRPDDLIGMISTISPEGWNYRVEIPDQIEAQKLVRGIVHALLLERANRGQGTKSAELPLWLVEGLAAHLVSVAGSDLVVGSVPIGMMLRIVRERKGLDSLQRAREVLRANPPLSFSELAYPRAAALQEDKLPVFQCSAQLFVYELLNSKAGAAGLVAMLRELPRCWNWETALLRAFPGQFERMLDVEKKWSVDILAFTARDASQVWARVVCLDKLEALLTVPVQVRVASDQLPQRQTLTLQQIIVAWDFSAQASVLRPKIALLEVLRFHSTADVVPLVDDYRSTLALYLEKRALAGRTPETRMQPALSASLVAQQAIRELELLDKRREELRPESVLSANPR